MEVRERSGWTRTAAFVWAALLLGLAVFGWRYPWSHTVFNIYAEAARRWWAGVDLYTPIQCEHYRYSPLFAICVTPFTWLSDSWGNALWRLFNGIALVATLGEFARLIFSQDRSGKQKAIFLLLVLPLSLHSLYNAQANLLMLAGMLCGLVSIAEDRWNRAAACMAFATLIKGYPLALALIVCSLFPRQFIVRFAIAMAMGLALPFVTMQPSVVVSQYASWAEHLRDSTVIMRERLRSIDHLWILYGSGISAGRFMMLQLGAGIAVLAGCTRLTRRPASQARLVSDILTLFSLWIVLFGPATEACTYVVLAPALAMVLLQAFLGATPLFWRLGLVLAMLLMGPCTTDMVGPVVRNFANEHGSQPIGALVFLAYLLCRPLWQVRYLDRPRPLGNQELPACLSRQTCPT